MTTISPERPAARLETPDELASRPLRVLMVLGILLANLLSSIPRLDISSRQLFDTDGYMRAVRVLDLVSGRNGWFDGWVHQANAPFGHPMHWTRLLDAILVGLGAPVAPLVGWRDAVYVASILVGPVIHVLLGFAVAWLAKPLMSAGAAYLSGLAVAVPSGILSYSAAGRPDHHILILLLAVLMAGCVLRMLNGPTPRYPLIGGLAAAAGLWVSVEFLAPLALCLAALAVSWIRGGGGGADNARFGRGLVVGVTAALFVERGPGDLVSVAYDRISIVHLLLAVLIWGLWEAMFRLPAAHSWRRRLVAFGAAGLVATLVMGLLVRPFFAGPFAVVPEALKAYWLDNVAELAPLWLAAEQRWSSVILLAGAALIGLPLGVKALLSSARQRRPLGPWLLIVAWLLFFTVLAVRNVRFVVYPEALAAVPIAWWASVQLMKPRPGSGVLRSLRRVGLMAFAVVGFAVPAGVVWAIEGPAVSPPSAADCDLRNIVPSVENALGTTGTPPVVLATIDAGPELLWRLPVSVVADPYFNVEGILDTRAFFSATDVTSAREVLDRHEVSLVLVCAGDPESPFPFHTALMTGTAPAGSGLELVEDDPPYLLYRYTP